MAKASTSKTVAAAAKRTDRVYFTSQDNAIELPNLVDHQNKSFQWFVEEGLGELLAEISPIDDYTGTKLSLSFKSYHFEDPKYDVEECQQRSMTYAAPLKVTLRARTTLVMRPR